MSYTLFSSLLCFHIISVSSSHSIQDVACSCLTSPPSEPTFSLSLAHPKDNKRRTEYGKVESGKSIFHIKVVIP
jgi:hypothetical protein